MNESTAAARRLLVYVSVLNWNAAAATLVCLESLLASELPSGVEMRVFVVDNASAEQDWRQLQAGKHMSAVQLRRNTVNLGFAGGHNPIIKQAIDDQADFIWLLNNDTEFAASTLAALLAACNASGQIGAVSPVVVALHDESVVIFSGGSHHWQTLEAPMLTTMEEGRSLQCTESTNTWLSGAAILLRVSALKQVGLLNEPMFAYYEDNDISCRLVDAGWKIRVAFDCVVRHAVSVSVAHHRPPYFFYLMARNSFFFWRRHTPAPFRQFLTLRLLDREILTANRLHSLGLTDKANACLLGVFDSLTGKGGPPALGRPVPTFFMNALRRLRWPNHKHHL